MPDLPPQAVAAAQLQVAVTSAAKITSGPVYWDQLARAALEAARPHLEARERPTLEQMLREFHGSKAIHGGLMPARPTTDIPGWVADLRMDLLTEEVRELEEALCGNDIVKIADALGDIAYVIAGTAVVYGLPFDAVLAEVHRSNMTKHNTPAEAKLVKGPDYEPPDIAGVLGLEPAP